MRALIDADILRYEIGFMGQPKIDGELEYLRFDRVAELLHQRINTICEEVGATEPPVLYLTSSKSLCKMMGIEYVPNFREDLANKKVYKGQRVQEKPFHFNNLTAYILSEFDVKVANGMEADDLICIDHLKDVDNTIICSRDKDLRMCPGRHYSWACGKQLAKGPILVEDRGFLEKNGNKIVGYGWMFFYYQLLVGDAVDNIPGAPSWGPAKSFKLLSGLENESERHVYEAVRDIYKECYPDSWKEELQEQANLLWMVRELREGEPVMYKPPSKEEVL